MRVDVEARIDIADLQADLGARSVGEETADQPGKGRKHRDPLAFADDRPDRLAFAHDVSDGRLPPDDSLDRRSQHPFSPASPDRTGTPGVRCGRTLPEHAAEARTTLRLHHCMAVLPHDESRPEADDERGVAKAAVERSLGQPGIDDNVGPEIVGQDRGHQERDHMFLVGKGKRR